MPRFQDVIYLGVPEEVEDEYGNRDFKFTYRKVYANRWRDGERGKTATTGAVTEQADVYDKREIRRYEILTSDYRDEQIGKEFPEETAPEWEIRSSWRGDRTLLEFRKDVIE